LTDEAQPLYWLVSIRHLGLLALLVACAPAPQRQAKPGAVRIVTTLGILADWAEQVGGDRVQVTSLLTGLESPHTYEIKPADVKTIADANVLFRVGLGMEDWLLPAVENSGNTKLVVVDAAAGIADIIGDTEHRPKAEVRRQKSEGRSKASGVGRGASSVEHASGNPHVWLDPEYAKTGIENLVRVLSQVDPKGESLYRAREARYFQRLDSLSAVIAAGFAGLSDRRFITYHEAWPYFARRFGLQVVASIEPIPGQEPSARELARLVDLIRRERIKVVTTEPQLPSALPDMLAKETGVKVLTLNPLESGGGYIAALGRAAEELVSALK
jgi:ABC-type Zn uptake system ZnuABC Zn-binding protein ZnuA